VRGGSTRRLRQRFYAAARRPPAFAAAGVRARTGRRRYPMRCSAGGGGRPAGSILPSGCLPASFDYISPCPHTTVCLRSLPYALLWAPDWGVACAFAAFSVLTAFADRGVPFRGFTRRWRALAAAVLRRHYLRGTGSRPPLSLLLPQSRLFFYTIRAWTGCLKGAITSVLRVVVGSGQDPSPPPPPHRWTLPLYAANGFFRVLPGW